MIHDYESYIREKPSRVQDAKVKQIHSFSLQLVKQVARFVNFTREVR